MAASDILKHVGRGLRQTSGDVENLDRALTRRQALLADAVEKRLAVLRAEDELQMRKEEAERKKLEFDAEEKRKSEDRKAAGEISDLLKNGKTREVAMEGPRPAEDYGAPGPWASPTPDPGPLKGTVSEPANYNDVLQVASRVMSPKETVSAMQKPLVAGGVNEYRTKLETLRQTNRMAYEGERQKNRLALARAMAFLRKEMAKGSKKHYSEENIREAAAAAEAFQREIDAVETELAEADSTGDIFRASVLQQKLPTLYSGFKYNDSYRRAGTDWLEGQGRGAPSAAGGDKPKKRRFDPATGTFVEE